MSSGSTSSKPKSEGAAALLGMFDPPPGASTAAKDSSKPEESSTSTSDSDRVKAEIASFSAMATAPARDSFNAGKPPTSPKKQAQASALMGMFEAPSTGTTSAGSASASSNKSPQHSSTNTSSLMGMFDPPKAASPRKSSTEASNLLSMFEPPQSTASTPDRPSSTSTMGLSPENIANMRPSLMTTERHTNSNHNSNNPITERTNLLQDMFDESSPTPKPTKNFTNKLDYNTNQGLLSIAPPPLGSEESQSNIHYVPTKQPLGGIQESTPNTTPSTTSWKEFFQHHFQPTTFAGAFMFLLYHVVFCLANGSAIVRPHAEQPILGEMAKFTALGIFFAGPFYIARLGTDVPAVYPSVDLFLAPFLAAAAATVDQTLADDGFAGDSNQVFFASFAVLVAIGMFAAGLLLLLAATFKLANLGTFLPYSVLCGFFSAVGVLMWALAFSVDTNGLTWQHVFFSGDATLILHSVLHHLPSLVVGILMNILGPKHPFYVILLIIITIVVFYGTMFITGTTLEEAQEEQWFWSREELSIQATEYEGWLSYWVPPAPFGQFGSLIQGHVHWGAVTAGLKDMMALAFLYLLRSSIHASAMKKNINNLVCKKRVKKTRSESTATLPQPKRRHRKEPSYAQAAMNAVSDNIRLVNESLAATQRVSGARQSIRTNSPGKRMKASTGKLELPTTDEAPEKASDNSDEYEYIEVRPKPCRRKLKDIFLEYGSALMVVSFSGGFGVCPTVATSNTMYAIGAGGPAPQYGSVLLLILFYATDFHLVMYIPKACFSSLLVLGAVDTFVVWFFLSYKKTQDIWEWMVVPFIVAFSVIVGFLNAVFLGVGISTFIFVASFFRVGVVKFNATGLEIRSTIERSMVVADWLDIHGDYIQVLVLQNYLFFGNASSVLQYIATMFEDVDAADSPQQSFDLPPVPKVLIIDMSLNTGMDTSTLDIFAEIKELCKNNSCKLFLCGLSNRSKRGLALTGVKPEPGFRDHRLVRFFPDLDTALGRAEDLIASEVHEKDLQNHPQGTKTSRSGFQAAIKFIDEQHGQEFSKDLLGLEPHTVLVELQAGDRLFASDGGPIEDRGLFFIESGMLKIERDANETLTRGRSTSTRSRTSYGTIGNMHARSGTVGRQRASMKATARETTTQTFRLARIGPGWVCGAIEKASGLRHAGVHVAVSNCRLHHLTFQKLEMMEKEDPYLILHLYKMLSHLMARRQEITIEQLATFHSIMSSPAHSKPVSRAAIMALRR